MGTEGLSVGSSCWRDGILGSHWAIRMRLQDDVQIDAWAGCGSLYSVGTVARPISTFVIAVFLAEFPGAGVKCTA